MTASAVIGGSTALADIVITANDVILNGIGSGGNEAASVSVTASDNGADGGRVILQGTGDYRTSGAQTYNTGSVVGGAGTVVAVTGNSTMAAGGAGITFDEVYLDFDPLRTLTTGSTVHCERLVAYRGTLDLGRGDDHRRPGGQRRHRHLRQRIQFQRRRPKCDLFR